MMNEDQSINLTVWVLTTRFAECQGDVTLQSHMFETGRWTPAGLVTTLRMMAKDFSGRHHCYGCNDPFIEAGKEQQFRWNLSRGS